MYYMEIQLYEGGSVRNLQALLLFELLDSMKSYMVLRGMALSVNGHVSQGICTEGAQMCQFNMVTHLENWSYWEGGGVIQFFVVLAQRV